MKPAVTKQNLTIKLHVMTMLFISRDKVRDAMLTPIISHVTKWFGQLSELNNKIAEVTTD